MIDRNHNRTADNHYDLIIIGGGVYGIALSLVASQMGLRNLLLEKQDFGWATSYNSLRTIHGGLRYLQKMDLPRFFESVNERHWFLQEFPGLVTPLPCLMPLYGNGAFRPSVFRVALGINDMLTRNRNQCVRPEQYLENGQVISPAEVIRLFPKVDAYDLKGGAIWHDGGMPSCQLVVMEMLKRACNGGSTALNYTEVDRLLLDNRQVKGVHCTDLESGKDYEFMADKVVNAAGPWCRSLAASFDCDDPELFRYSIAWNVLLNKRALSTHSLAVKPKKPDARMYFIHGWHGLITGGTVHSPWHGITDIPMPDSGEIKTYLENLNLAVPGLNARPKDIAQIYSGLLPVNEQGGNRISTREVMKDHGSNNGPQGLYTLSGVKFTTARKVAEKMLKHIFPGKTPLSATSLRRQQAADLRQLGSIFHYKWLPAADNGDWQEKLTAIIRDQAVLHLDDLIVRRTTIGDNPLRAMQAAEAISRIFPWDDNRRQEELLRLQDFFSARSPNRYRVFSE
jgi:glycerol-3-phosphate dehydrogenase